MFYTGYFSYWWNLGSQYQMQTLNLIIFSTFNKKFRGINFRSKLFPKILHIFRKIFHSNYYSNWKSDKSHSWKMETRKVELYRAGFHTITHLRWIPKWKCKWCLSCVSSFVREIDGCQVFIISTMQFLSKLSAFQYTRTYSWDSNEFRDSFRGKIVKNFNFGKINRPKLYIQLYICVVQVHYKR